MLVPACLFARWDFYLQCRYLGSVSFRVRNKLAQRRGCSLQQRGDLHILGVLGRRELTPARRVADYDQGKRQSAKESLVHKVLVPLQYWVICQDYASYTMKNAG